MRAAVVLLPLVLAVLLAGGLVPVRGDVFKKLMKSGLPLALFAGPLALGGLGAHHHHQSSDHTPSYSPPMPPPPPPPPQIRIITVPQPVAVPVPVHHHHRSVVKHHHHKGRTKIIHVPRPVKPKKHKVIIEEHHHSPFDFGGHASAFDFKNEIPHHGDKFDHFASSFGGHGFSGHGLSGHHMAGHGLSGHHMAGHGLSGHHMAGHSLSGHHSMAGHGLSEHHHMSGHGLSGHNMAGHGFAAYDEYGGAGGGVTGAGSGSTDIRLAQGGYDIGKSEFGAMAHDALVAHAPLHLDHMPSHLQGHHHHHAYGHHEHGGHALETDSDTGSRRQLPNTPLSTAQGKQLQTRAGLRVVERQHGGRRRVHHGGATSRKRGRAQHRQVRLRYQEEGGHGKHREAGGGSVAVGGGGGGNSNRKNGLDRGSAGAGASVSSVSYHVQGTPSTGNKIW